MDAERAKPHPEYRPGRISLVMRRKSGISRPWRLHQNFSCQVEANGWFSAIKLIARISGPGHERPLVASFQIQLTKPMRALLTVCFLAVRMACGLLPQFHPRFHLRHYDEMVE